MTKKRSTFPVLILIFTLISACFGAATMGPAVTTGTFTPSAALGAQETFEGLRQAMRACPGTFIMERGNLLLMAWPRGTAYAFAIIGKDGSAGADLTGLRVSTLSISAMVKSLEEGGWRYILPAAVPSTIAKALGMLSVEMALTSMRAMPSIFLIPLWIMEPTPVEVQ